MNLHSSYIFLEQDSINHISSSADGKTIRIDVDKMVCCFIKKTFASLSESVNKDYPWTRHFNGSLYSCDVEIIEHTVDHITYLNIYVSGDRKSKIISCIEEIQADLMSSGIRQYYIDIVSYDAVSEYFCNQIVGKLNSLERNIRNLLLNIYTLNYGKEYFSATMQDDILISIKRKIASSFNKQKAQIKKVYSVNSNDEAEEIYRIREILSSFEFNDLQRFLFENKWTQLDEKDRDNFLKTHPNLSELNDSEIRSAIKNYSPRNDWDKLFADKIDSSDNIKQMLEIVRNYRNSIAHFKTFDRKDYEDCKSTISKLNKAICKAIKITEENDFVDKNINELRTVLLSAKEMIHKFFKFDVESFRQGFLDGLKGF